jgi:hypothetical protein
MPIRYAEGDEPCAAFQATCVPEEADLLLEWLRRTHQPAADLSACREIHSALFQLLLAGRVQLVAPPGDTILAECLSAGGSRPVSPIGRRVDLLPPLLAGNPAAPDAKVSL